MLAGNACLAKAAGGRWVLQPVFQSLFMKRFGADIFPTFILIMAFFRDGACRTPGDALPTGFISEEETILFGMAVSFFARGKFQKGDHTADPHGHSFRGDESVIQAERSETTCISDMALRPGRGPARLLIPKGLEGRQQD